MTWRARGEGKKAEWIILKRREKHRRAATNHYYMCLSGPHSLSPLSLFASEWSPAKCKAMTSTDLTQHRGNVTNSGSSQHVYFMHLQRKRASQWYDEHYAQCQLKRPRRRRLFLHSLTSSRSKKFRSSQSDQWFIFYCILSCHNNSIIAHQSTRIVNDRSNVRFGKCFRFSQHAAALGS